ncbi:MAG: competence protein CoiA family protein [Bacillota bacterium]|nr:competence protein CoiA family protein [Bacillota bacterium]
MLTAKMKDGRRLCLGYEYKKETLFILREKEEFFCPVCGERVILKLGDKKIYHFAHRSKSACREYVENETETHLSGKLQLYQWLKKQKLYVELEYYDKEIQQRPDILFIYNGKKYALEYQCSVIPEEIFKKRTLKYLQNGYTPLWILGGKHFNQMGSLSSFHFLFLQKTNDSTFYIPYYSPEKKFFLLQHSIFPYSTKNAIFQKKIIPIDQLKIVHLLEPALQGRLDFKKWRDRQENYKLRFASYPNNGKKFFLNELYQQGLNLFLMPVEIGLPVPLAFTILTPLFVWQTYIFLDVFKYKQGGNFIYLKEVENCFDKRIKKGDIQIRQGSFLSNYLQPVNEYLYLLEKLGTIKRVKQGIFQLSATINLPKTNMEREEIMNCFYKNNLKTVDRT